jgi:hypothetical protein
MSPVVSDSPPLCNSAVSGRLPWVSNSLPCVPKVSHRVSESLPWASFLKVVSLFGLQSVSKICVLPHLFCYDSRDCDFLPRTPQAPACLLAVPLFRKFHPRGTLYWPWRLQYSQLAARTPILPQCFVWRSGVPIIPLPYTQKVENTW